MMIRLNQLSPAPGSRKNRKRIGRGPGSGHGKTAGHGMKGQRARSGSGIRIGFEGGQMPLARRLPKRGFTNIFRKKVAIVNLSQLERFEAGTVIDEALLRKAGLVKGQCDAIKLLGKGNVDRAFTIQLHRVSKSARQKIEDAGGTVEVIGG